MKILSRQFGILFLLVFLFFAPGLAALYFYEHPQSLSRHATNKGEFVAPPVQIPSLKNRSTAERPIGAANSKWRLLLWDPNECTDACRQRLSQLNQIRLALGRHYYEVDELLLSGAVEENASLGIETLHCSPDEIRVLTKVSPDARIFIANPSGYLVLSYAMDAPSDDIYHDLHHLLSTTQKS